MNYREKLHLILDAAKTNIIVSSMSTIDPMPARFVSSMSTIDPMPAR